MEILKIQHSQLLLKTSLKRALSNASLPNKIWLELQLDYHAEERFLFAPPSLLSLLGLRTKLELQESEATQLNLLDRILDAVLARMDLVKWLYKI